MYEVIAMPNEAKPNAMNIAAGIARSAHHVVTRPKAAIIIVKAVA